MFYVTRKAPTGVFIYDDTDGVEEKVSFQELKKLVLNGVEIKGVDAWYNITPVQISHNAKSAKYSVLRGIDYQVDDDGCLLNLKVNNKDAVVVLSDICSSVEAYSLSEVANNVTFVLDDKLKSIHNKAFINLRFNSFTIDVTQLTDNKTVFNIYKYGRFIFYTVHYNAPVSYRVKIIDRKSRRDKFECELAIMKHRYYFPNLTPELDVYVLGKYKKKLLAGIPGKDSFSLYVRKDRAHMNALGDISYLNGLYMNNTSKQEMLKAIQERGCSFLISKLYWRTDNLGVRSAWCYLMSGGSDDDIYNKYCEYIHNCYLKFEERFEESKG